MSRSTLGAGHDPVRAKGAVAAAGGARQGAQSVVLGKSIRDAGAAAVEAETHDIVRAARDPHHQPLRGVDRGNISGTKAHSIPGLGEGRLATRAVGKNMW